MTGRMRVKEERGGGRDEQAGGSPVYNVCITTSVLALSPFFLSSPVTKFVNQINSYVMLTTRTVVHAPLHTPLPHHVNTPFAYVMCENVAMTSMTRYDVFSWWMTPGMLREQPVYIIVLVTIDVERDITMA